MGSASFAPDSLLGKRLLSFGIMPTIKYKIEMAEDHSDNRGRMTVRLTLDGFTLGAVETRVYDWERLSSALANLHVLDEQIVERARRNIEAGTPFEGITNLTEDEFRKLDSDHFVH